MKTLSLNSFYLKIKKHIKLTEAYTEIKGLAQAIRICRLKPYNLLQNKNMELILHNHWADEFGNSLYIKGKEIQIINNDLAIDINSLVCTDPYYGLSIDRIIKMSKFAYVCVGRDDETYEFTYFVALLGIDNYLRCFLKLEDEWEKASPLVLGWKNLERLVKNIDNKEFVKYLIKDNYPFPCMGGEAWLSCLPGRKGFLQKMKAQHEALYSLFNFTKGNTK